MFQIQRLKNGLTLITIPLPQLDSVTSLVAVGAGSRYETRRIGGISHFLEHMFFKGSKKYPSAELIATLVDGIGALNNAFTYKEYTAYWIKSASKHVELATDIISSMLKESLLQEEEIEREKGVIVEERRLYQDNPQRWVWDAYYQLQFGDQPLGWNVIGEEKIVNSLQRKDFVSYVNSLYAPSNLTLVYAGKVPKNIKQIAEKHFLDLPKRAQFKPKPVKKTPQTKPKVNIFYKQTDQANLILGVEGYSRANKKRYITDVLETILGDGMSSRLFIQVRERRGLAYTVRTAQDNFLDTGTFVVYAGLKLEKVEEGLAVIKTELERMVTEKVTAEEMKKAKEMIRGRIALSSESTNFLAEHFGLEFVLDRKLESFEEYLKKIEAVTAEDIQKVAAQLFQTNRYNLQVVGPFKNKAPFEKILNS